MISTKVTIYVFSIIFFSNEIEADEKQTENEQES